MNDEQIFELAEKCGFQDDFGYWNFKDEGLLDFVFLVQNAEREACAKVCEELVLAYAGNASATANQCADAIRARGEE